MKVYVLYGITMWVYMVGAAAFVLLLLILLMAYKERNGERR